MKYIIAAVFLSFSIGSSYAQMFVSKPGFNEQEVDSFVKKEKAKENSASRKKAAEKLGPPHIRN